VILGLVYFSVPFYVTRIPHRKEKLAYLLFDLGIIPEVSSQLTMTVISKF